MSFQVLTVASREIVFWDVVPCRLVLTDRRFRGVYCPHHQDGDFLMMKAESTYKMPVNFYETTRRNVLEDKTGINNFKHVQILRQ
jgi:hypothetical protein